MSYLTDLLGDAYREGMTEDEISEALEQVNNDSNAEINRLKAAISKSNSEAATYRKQLRSKQSEEEAQAQAQKEQLDNLVEENNRLKRSISLAENKAKLIAIGYDEKLATDTAEALCDGDTAKILANQAKYNESQKKNIIAEHMRNMGKPPAGSADNATDYNKLAMEARDRGDLALASAYIRKANAQNS